jgi:hypothetical protein
MISCAILLMIFGYVRVIHPLPRVVLTVSSGESIAA